MARPHERSRAADAFVAAVLTGNWGTANGAGCDLLAEMSDTGDWARTVCEGVILRNDQVPTDPLDVPGDEGPGVELLQGVVGEARFAKLNAGADMTPDEARRWSRLAAEYLLSTTDLDWDVYAAWAIREIRASDGRVAYMADCGGGYSFSKVTMEYAGAGATPDDALEHLKTFGFVTVEDFRERYRPEA